MRIAKYISNLLFEYECIVIPGLGGFITNELPAQINASQHSFSPPSKKIVFNVRLQTNDGMLVNHIADKEKISFTDARMRIENFVAKCHKALDNNKRIHFHKIGILFKENSGEILFEPDTSYNYLSHSYELTSFISPAIKRDPAFRIEKKFTDRKPKRKPQPEIEKEEPLVNQVKKPRYFTINVFGLIAILGIIALVVFNFGSIKKVYNNYSSVIPLFYSTPNEYLIMNHGNKITNTTLQQDQLNTSSSYPFANSDSDNEIQTSSTDQDDFVEETITEEPVTNFDSEGNQDDPVGNADDIKEENIDDDFSSESDMVPAGFYIIAGSFKDEGNASKFVSQLIDKNFDAAIIGRNKYGLYRVAYAGFATRAEAERQLAIIRKEINPSAWIFSKW